MLTQKLIELLRSLRLTGMAEALERQLTQPATHEDLSFEERLGLLIDAEATARENRRIERGLRAAKLRYRALVHDIDYRPARGLKKAQMASLINGDWLHKHQGLLITGKTGTGKSWLACALGDHACRLGFTVRYFRASRLFKALEIGRGDGSYPKQLAQLARTDLLIIDDLGVEPLSARNRTDLLELMEDRYAERSVLITSQLPVKSWHKAIGDPTLADAILDRLVHNAHRLELEGETMRRGLEAKR
jgi:DNA replication protein DnaC